MSPLALQGSASREQDRQQQEDEAAQPTAEADEVIEGARHTFVDDGGHQPGRRSRSNGRTGDGELDRPSQMPGRSLLRP